jgi:hypothetical protein
MVTSQKMSENEMGYRGSKSEIQSPQPKEISVKEQRVDGSYFQAVASLRGKLRYILMGFERSYQVRFLSKQINKLFFSTQLNPYFVTGFCDAESSFQVLVTKKKNSRLGWTVRLFFTIGLLSRDLALLLRIKEFFGCGYIVKNDKKNVVSFRITSLEDITNILIPHFSRYPLLTQKAADFKLFLQVTELMKNKGHFTTEGLQEIINIKCSMNLGLSDELTLNFFNTVPVQRPTIKTINIPDFYWISGFVSGEGNFFVDIFKSSSNKIGYQVKLRLSVTQHKRDKELLELIASYLGAGIVNIHSEKAYVFKITKLVDLTTKIIPLFDKKSIQGVKHLDYLDFCEVAKIMSEGKHLTTEGMDWIRTIKNKMNMKRKIDSR